MAEAEQRFIHPGRPRYSSGATINRVKAQPKVTSPLAIPTTLVAPEGASHLAARLEGGQSETNPWRITGVLTEDPVVPALVGAAPAADGRTLRVPRAPLGGPSTAPIRIVAAPVVANLPLPLPRLQPQAHFPARGGNTGQPQQPPVPPRFYAPVGRPPAAQPPVPGPRVNPGSSPLPKGFGQRQPKGFVAGLRGLVDRLRNR